MILPRGRVWEDSIGRHPAAFLLMEGFVFANELAVGANSREPDEDIFLLRPEFELALAPRLDISEALDVGRVDKRLLAVEMLLLATELVRIEALLVGAVDRRLPSNGGIGERARLPDIPESIVPAMEGGFIEPLEDFTVLVEEGILVLETEALQASSPSAT
jgi:hypothetical protein